MIIELAKTAVTALHVELLDSKKATFKYLSVSDSEVCYKNVSEQTKKSCIGCKATNDEAESALGGATQQVQAYGRVDLSAAAAVSAMRKNKFLYRPTKKNDKKGTRDCFMNFQRFYGKLLCSPV